MLKFVQKWPNLDAKQRKKHGTDVASVSRSLLRGVGGSRRRCCCKGGERDRPSKALPGSQEVTETSLLISSTQIRVSGIQRSGFRVEGLGFRI